MCILSMFFKKYFLFKISKFFLIIICLFKKKYIPLHSLLRNKDNVLNKKAKERVL